MIDSHCHLDHEPLISDLENVLLRSKKVGIKKLLTISTSLESFNKVKEIVNKDEIIFGTIGIHPHETNNNTIDVEFISKNIKENQKIIGIGETGLDFYYNHSDKKDQMKLFEQHILAAQKCEKPIIAEGRYESAKQISSAFKLGATAVVVGTAITNPREITRKIVNQIEDL